MFRSYSLNVKWLAGRCVPAVAPDMAALSDGLLPRLLPFQLLQSLRVVLKATFKSIQALINVAFELTE